MPGKNRYDHVSHDPRIGGKEIIEIVKEAIRAAADTETTKKIMSHIQTRLPTQAEQADKSLVSEFTVATVLVDILTFAESPIYLNKVFTAIAAGNPGGLFRRGRVPDIDLALAVIFEDFHRLDHRRIRLLNQRAPDPYYLFQGLIN